MKVDEVGPLRIGGYQIAVDVENQHLAVAGVLGAYACDELKIMMKDEGPPQLVAETLIHEVLHAIAEIYLEGYADGVSEHVVAMLGQGLFQVLRDNPGFAAFVTGGFDEPELEGGAECTERCESTALTGTWLSPASQPNGHVIGQPTT